MVKMKKGKMTSVIIVALSCCLAITMIYSGIHYYFNCATTNWFKETSEDGDFLISGKEKGHPFGFGYTTVQVEVERLQDKKSIVWYETGLNNEGNRLSEENYDIEYTEKYIKISLIDFQGEISATYRFYFEDFMK